MYLPLPPLSAACADELRAERTWRHSDISAGGVSNEGAGRSSHPVFHPAEEWGFVDSMFYISYSTTGGKGDVTKQR